MSGFFIFIFRASAPVLTSGKRFLIATGTGQFDERVVLGLLFLENLFQHRGGLGVAQQNRPCVQAPIRGDGVVFNFLCGGNQRCINGGLPFEVSGETLALFQQASRGLTFLRTDCGVERLENSLQFFQMTFRFLKVTLKMFLQRLARCQLDQLRNGLNQLFFRIISVGQFFQE